MLRGLNELRLNESTMTAVVQHYFDTVLFKDSGKTIVKSVSMATEGAYSSKVFVVSTTDENN